MSPTLLHRNPILHAYMSQRSPPPSLMHNFSYNKAPQYLHDIILFKLQIIARVYNNIRYRIILGVRCVIWNINTTIIYPTHYIAVTQFAVNIFSWILMTDYIESFVYNPQSSISIEEETSRYSSNSEAINLHIDIKLQSHTGMPPDVKGLTLLGV